MTVNNSDIIFPNIRDSIAKSNNNNNTGKAWFKSLLDIKSSILTLNTDIETTTTTLTDEVNTAVTNLTTLVDTLQALICPTGSLRWSAASTQDSGWFICNGQAVSRTTYSALFAVISTTYGSGDGSTTFNVPNTQGLTLIGMGGGYSLAGTGGSSTVTLTAAQQASMPVTSGSISISYGSTVTGTTYPTAAENTQGTNVRNYSVGAQTATGGGGAHNNMQPYLVGNLLIKY